MTFLEIFRATKNKPSVFFKVFDDFKDLFFDEAREYAFLFLLELRLSPDLKSLGFFRYYSDNDCDMIASMSFFDLKLIVKDDDFLLAAICRRLGFISFLLDC